MIMLCTHCVHPLCNLPSLRCGGLLFWGPEPRLGGPLPGPASTGVVFFYLKCFTITSCITSHSSRPYVLHFLCHCLPSAISLFTPISFFFFPLASLPLMRLFNIFAWPLSWYKEMEDEMEYVHWEHTCISAQPKKPHISPSQLTFIMVSGLEQPGGPNPLHILLWT